MTSGVPAVDPGWPLLSEKVWKYEAILCLIKDWSSATSCRLHQLWRQQDKLTSSGANFNSNPGVGWVFSDLKKEIKNCIGVAALVGLFRIML